MTAANEATQAAFIGDLMTKWQEMPYAGPIMIHTTRDRRTGSSDPEDVFGVFRTDWSAKPSQQTMKSAIAAGIPKTPQFQRFSEITDDSYGEVLSPVYRAIPTVWAQARTDSTLYETPTGIIASPNPVAERARQFGVIPKAPFKDGYQDVTSLTAEAASFFSHRLGVEGQSSPQDVACSVFVGLRMMPTALTDEFCLADAVLACCVSTVLAAVGGVPGVDLDPYTPSVLRFGAQNTEETAPARVTDTSVQPGLRPASAREVLAGNLAVGYRFGSANYIRDRQILHHQQVIPLNESAGLLVMKVPALVGDLAVPRRDRLPSGLTITPTAASPL